MPLPSFVKKITKSLLGENNYRSVQDKYRQLRSSSEKQIEYSPRLADSDRQAVPSPFNFVVDQNNVLEDLGRKYEPTKQQHDYLKYYWMHLRDIRHKVKTVLEIGVQSDRSIRLWEEFFPNATIFGLDIDPACQKFEGGRCQISIGDQSDKKFLQSVVERTGPIDIIIDDGSHIPDHQLITFDYLFPHMTENGIYVMEDTGGVVSDEELRTVNYLKSLIDHVMYWPSGFDPRDWPKLSKFDERSSWADRNIIGLAFYRWIVFVFRGRNPENNRNLQPIDEHP